MKNKTNRIAFGLISLITLGLMSCSEKKLNTNEIVKKNAEEYAKSKMNDPESFEFVKLELVDSVLFSNNIEYRKDYFGEQIQNDQSSLETNEAYKTEDPSNYDENEVQDLKESIKKNEKILSKIDSIANELGSKKNEVASYTYIFSFRGKNALGAKVLNEYVLQTSPAPDFKVVNMTKDKDKILLNPNGFPGYREMIEKNL